VSGGGGWRLCNSDRSPSVIILKCNHRNGFHIVHDRVSNDGREGALTPLHLGKRSQNSGPFFSWVSSPGGGGARRASILIHLALPLQQARWSLRRDGAPGAPILDHHTRGRPGISLRQKYVRSAGIKIYSALSLFRWVKGPTPPPFIFRFCARPPPQSLGAHRTLRFRKTLGAEEKPLSV